MTTAPKGQAVKGIGDTRADPNQNIREESKMRNNGKFMTMMMFAAVTMLSIGISAATAAGPALDGTAYIAGHGGHLAVLDLATGDLTRVVVATGAPGVDPAFMTAGMKNAIVGTHGQTLIGRNLYIGLLDGRVTRYNLDKGDLVDLGKVGKKLCGAVPGPGGNIYFEDMADGKVYVFDPKKEKKADVIPAGKSICGIGWDTGDKNAFISDMVQGKVLVMDWSTKKVVSTIDNVGTFLHQARTNPDRSEFWVTAGNEFKQEGANKTPWATAGKGKGEVVIIDTAKKEITGRIVADEGVYPHDLAFTPDGKYALVTARTYADDSIMLTIDAKTHEVLNETSLCKGCHEMAGVKVTIDKGSPLLCGIEVDWKK